MRDLQELKQEIADATGIPINILGGKDETDIIAHAKALLILKRDTNPEELSPEQQFALYVNDALGEDPTPFTEFDRHMQALNAIESGLGVAPNSDVIKDGGEVKLDTPREPRNPFEEWAIESGLYRP